MTSTLARQTGYRLHLVRPVAAPGLDQIPVQHGSVLMRLVGVRSGVETGLRHSAFHTLLGTLWPHETVQCVQRFGASYSLQVRLLQTLVSRAGETHIAFKQALEATCPGWQWQTVNGFEQVACSDLLPLRALLRPVSLAATPKVQQAPGRPADRSGQKLTPASDGGLLTHLPYPGKFPDWRLTTPFEEALVDGEWQLDIRLTRQLLDDTQQMQLQRTLSALRGGAVRLRMAPNSTAGLHQGAFAGSQDWADEATLRPHLQSHLHELLDRSAGYKLVVGVRTHSQFTHYALQRLARDLFGAFPAEIFLTDDSAAAGENFATQASHAELCTWPLLAKQGLPALFPSDACLLAAGVPQVAPEPMLLPNEPGIEIGHTSGKSPVLLPDRLRTGHMLVLGASGAGKSGLLRRLVAEELARGAGLAYIDPHGSDAQAILESIPPEREGDVVWVDAADPQHLVGLNPMQGTQEDPRLRHFVATQIAELIDALFETKDSTGPMMRSVLRNALSLAMAHPQGGTLYDAQRIFADDDFRDMLLGCCPDKHLVQKWKHFAKTSGDYGYGNWRPYANARLEPMTTGLAMMGLLNRPSTINLAELIKRNAIILVRLPKAALTEQQCRLLGALLLLQFHTAALTGHARGVQGQRPFQLVVDEFHSFATPGVPAMFRELRKFNVALCVATQSVDSLRHPQAGDIATAVLTNTAIKCFFRLSPREAIALDEYTAPEFPAQHVARLPNHQAVLNISAAGLPPFQFHPGMPQPPVPAANAEWVKALSAARHATPVAEVRRQLLARHDLQEDCL